MSVRTTLQTKDGIRRQYVLIVEGYPDIITSGTASVASFDAEFSTSIRGLQIMGSIENTIRPWEPEVQVSSLSFGVMDAEGTDAFGEAVFGSGAGAETYLTASIDCNDTTIPAQDTTDFASSGTIYIGCETITYSGKTSTSFTGCTRGRYAPFRAASESNMRFGRAHELSDIGDGQQTMLKPKITSAPRMWKGRWVGLWMCEVVGGVLSTKANSQVLWAGRIRSVRDDQRGMTILDCDDMRSSIKDTMLLRNQWSAKVAEGFDLVAGFEFNAKDNKSGVTKTANPLRVVVGASGTDEIEAGITSLDELASAINRWAGAEKAAGRLNFSWTWSPRVTATDGSMRSKFHWSNGHATDLNWTKFVPPNDDVALFMGSGGTDTFFRGSDLVGWTGSEYSYYSDGTPYRVLMTMENAGEVAIEDVKGEIFDNQAHFPVGIGLDDSVAGTYAALRVGSGPIGLFQIVDDETIQFVSANSYLDKIAGTPWNTTDFGQTNGWRAIPADQGGDLRLTQVAILNGTLSALLTQFLCSTGTADYNSPTNLDNLPSQLGAAIPYELLGNTWKRSIGSLETAWADLVVVLDKPTKLTEAIGGDLVARLVSLVLKPAAGGSWGTTGGMLRAATWGTPVADLATHALTEANKAIPADTDRPNMRTVTQESDIALVNHLRIAWNRDLGSDGYKDSANIISPASVTDTGVTRGPTISMRNVFSAEAHSDDAMDEIVSGLVAAVGLFDRPLRLMRRTIDLSLFDGIGAGDFGTISDNFARDPSTGERGLSNKAHLLVGHRLTWGGWQIDAERSEPPTGEVEILILPRNDISVYSPTAYVDHSQANGGYDAVNQRVTCIAHQHSESAETADAQWFSLNHAVDVIEVDPDDPAAPQSWTNLAVTAQSGNTITFNSPLTGWNSSKYYRVVSTTYDDAATSQRTRVYLADDATNLIDTGVSAYVFGYAPQQAEDSDWTIGSYGPIRLAANNAYGAGQPLSTGDEEDGAVLANNLVSCTGPNLPQLYPVAIATPSGGGGPSVVRAILECRRLHFGPGNLGTGDRYVRLQPKLRRGTAGAAVKLYATLTRNPPKGSSWTATSSTEPEYQLYGPMSTTVEWSTSSTTWATGTVQDISIRVADVFTGNCWLVVEADPNIEYRGMVQCRTLRFLSPDEI